MADLNNQSEKYEILIAEIEKGQLKIPQFQRKFVWPLERSAGLIDSMLKGYPIGTFIFWKTEDRLRSIRNIGNIDEFPEPEGGDFINYVLDGQQRIASIYAILKGVKIKKEDGKKEVDYSKVFIDLETEHDDEPWIITDISEKEEKTYIKVVDLMKGGIASLNEYPEKYHKPLDEFRTKLRTYDFSIIYLKNASIDVATEVFTRLNVGGKALSVFEIMVAKTYDAEKNFDLSEKFDKLIEELGQSAQYDTLSNATVLQVVSILLKKGCKRKQILKLPKEDFIGIWDEATKAIKRTIDYFRSSYKIPVSELLPYNALIVTFSWYFHKEKKNPTGDIQKRMQDLFWRISLGNRYSSSLESKIVQDIEKIEKILKGEELKYEWGIEIEPQHIIDDGRFKTGRSFIKAILAILTSQTPKSFRDNATVMIDNSWLQRANSKNYHHFFPKAFMRKKQPEIEDWRVNNIVNITIVDESLNKSTIRDKPPSEYMEEFSEKNENIGRTMKSHLIGDFKKIGIPDNNFEVFLEKRASLISKEIKKRIIENKESSKLHPYDEGAEDNDDDED